MRMLKMTLRYVILISVSAAFVFPVLFMLTNSFMSTREITRSYSILMPEGSSSSRVSSPSPVKFKLIPEKISLHPYYQVFFRKPKFLVMFWNSVILTVPIVMGQLLVATLAAYSFSKLGFPFHKFIFFLYILVMMMPFQVTLVPNYIILNKMSMLGTVSAVILPGVFSTFGVFLLRQFMIMIPDAYVEAAEIDGAGYLRSFIKIVLPQCRGALASLAILLFVDNWNMVEQPLIFLNDPSGYPLSIFLSYINADDMGIAFACGVLFMIPALLIFLYGEKELIQGIELSGIK